MRERSNRRPFGGAHGTRGRTIVLGMGFVSLAALAFCCGRYLPPAAAAPPAPADKAPLPSPSPDSAADYARRPVAYIYGTIAITREDLGEYLIAREGAEKLELLVNKRIVEHVCKEKGIEITAGEIEAALAEDLKGLQVNLKEFENKVLRQYKKTLFEWKEDVIRPKLAMTKMCRNRVHVTTKDLEDAFTAHYGEKVEGRIILFPREEEKIAMNVWPKVRDNEEEFNRHARQQASPSLASTGGKIRPISRNSTGNPELEREVFSLQDGEVGKIVGAPEGLVIFKCDKRIPPDTTKKLVDVRAALEREIIDKKIQLEMPKIFKEMRDQAQPKLFIKKFTTEEDLKNDVQQILQSDSEIVKPRPGKTSANAKPDARE